MSMSLPKGVIVSFQIPSKGVKKITLPNTYDDLLQALEKSLSTLDSIYVFIIPPEVQLPIPCFYTEETFDLFRQQVLTKGLEKLTIKIELVIDYPDYELPKEITLDQQFTTCVNSLTESLKNSLITELEEEQLQKSKIAYIRQITENPKKEAAFTNVICKKCFNTFCRGCLFICAECPNYTLCAHCEKINEHDDRHTLIRVSEEIQEDMRKFDCCVMNKVESYAIDSSKGARSIDVNVSLINSGIDNWKDCYLRSVGYGEEYLNGPLKKIEGVVKSLDKISLRFTLMYSNKGRFLTKWRVFTSSGIPFGEMIIKEIIIN